MANYELEPEIKARALSARKRKRLEPLEEEINNRVIDLEATRDSVFIPNKLTNAPSNREGSEDNNRG